MNDRAREALVAAALNGTTQIKWVLQNPEGGFCAMGVITEAYCQEKYGRSPRSFLGPYLFEAVRWAGITEPEWEEIVRRNNDDGWDFLMIARKVGVPHE